MLIFIDNVAHELNVHKLSEDAHTAYKNHIVKGIPLPNGYVFSSDRTSLGQTILKQTVTMFVLPLVATLFHSRGEELPKPTRHTNILDYIVEQLLLFIGRHGDRVQVHVTTVQTDINSVKNIISVSTARQEALPPGGDVNENLTKSTS